MSGKRAILTTSKRELSSSLFFPASKAPKEIHAILTGTLACFLPGWAKDLSATLYKYYALVIKSIGNSINNKEFHSTASPHLGGIVTASKDCRQYSKSTA